MPPSSKSKSKSQSSSLSLSSFITSSSSPKSQRSPPSVPKPPHVILYDEWSKDQKPVTLTNFMRKNIELDINPSKRLRKPTSLDRKSKNAIYASNHRKKMKRGLTSLDPVQRATSQEFYKKKQLHDKTTYSNRTKKN